MIKNFEKKRQSIKVHSENFLGSGDTLNSEFSMSKKPHMMGKIGYPADGKETLGIPCCSIMKKDAEKGYFNAKDDDVMSKFSWQTDISHKVNEHVMPHMAIKKGDIIYKKYIKIKSMKFKLTFLDDRQFCCIILYIYNKHENMLKKIIVHYQDLANFLSLGAEVRLESQNQAVNSLEL